MVLRFAGSRVDRPPLVSSLQLYSGRRTLYQRGQWVWGKREYSRRLVLLAHHEGVRCHVPQALVLRGGQHRYKSYQAEEKAIYYVQHGPYSRSSNPRNPTGALPNDLYPKEHLPQGLPQISLENCIVGELRRSCLQKKSQAGLCLGGGELCQPALTKNVIDTLRKLGGLGYTPGGVFWARWLQRGRGPYCFFLVTPRGPELPEGLTLSETGCSGTRSSRKPSRWHLPGAGKPRELLTA